MNTSLPRRNEALVNRRNWRQLAVVSAVLAAPFLQTAIAQADHPRFDLDRVRLLSQQLDTDTNRAVYEARRYSHPNDSLDRDALYDLQNLEYSATQLRETVAYSNVDPYSVEAAFERVAIDNQESERTQRNLRGYTQVSHLLSSISRSVDSLNREINVPGNDDPFDSRLAQRLALEISQDTTQVIRQAQSEIHPRDPYKAQKQRAVRDVRVLKQDAQQLAAQIQQSPEDPLYSQHQLQLVRTSFAKARRSVGAARFSHYVAQGLNAIAGDLAALNRIYRDTFEPRPIPGHPGDPGYPGHPGNHPRPPRPIVRDHRR